MVGRFELQFELPASVIPSKGFGFPMDVKLVPVSVAEAEKAALLLKGSDAVLRTPLVRLLTDAVLRSPLVRLLTDAVLRTPLVRLLTHGVTAIYLKLENIQCVGHIETRVF